MPCAVLRYTRATMLNRRAHPTRLKRLNHPLIRLEVFLIDDLWVGDGIVIIHAISLIELTFLLII